MLYSISEILKTIGTFSKNDLNLFEQELRHKKIKEDDLLLKKGKLCTSIYFLESGSFYEYKVNDSNKTIIDLYTPGDWMFNHKSFVTRSPSEHFIKAFDESSIFEISVESLHLLIDKSLSFLQFGKLLENSTSRVIFFDNKLTPDEKYRYILENKAILLNVFPQTMISSYLKISPETLSRVRKRFLK